MFQVWISDDAACEVGSLLPPAEKKDVQMRLIVLVIIVILIVGALPAWPYSAGWGYYPSGGLGSILILLLILALLGII